MICACSHSWHRFPGTPSRGWADLHSGQTPLSEQNALCRLPLIQAWQASLALADIRQVSTAIADAHSLTTCSSAQNQLTGHSEHATTLED